MRLLLSQSARRTAAWAFAPAMIGAGPILAAPVRYRLIDYGGGDQAGHALSGFLEFDSPCGGDCTAASITNFSFTVSGPSNYSHSFARASDVFLTQTSDNMFLHAGVDSLSIDYRRSGTLILRNYSEAGSVLMWNSLSDGTYSSIGPHLMGEWQRTVFTPTLVVIGIAVPEPSAILLSITAVAIAGGPGCRLRLPGARSGKRLKRCITRMY